MVKHTLLKCNIIIYFILCLKFSNGLREEFPSCLAMHCISPRPWKFLDKKTQWNREHQWYTGPHRPTWPIGHPYYEPLSLKAPEWNMNIKDKGHEILQRGDTEPGFDLTNEEIKKLKLWPNGVVPYYIDVPSFSDKVLRDKIRLFLNVVNSLTSLNFMEIPSPPKDHNTRWVFFVNRRGLLGCADHCIKNFTNEGLQQVVLGYESLSTGGELAEAVLAIAGVPPQHNAPDRDDYIKVIDENIEPGKQYLFEKLKDNEWLFHDVEYDFFSAGHFHYHKHSANGRATIETQAQYFGAPIGEANGLSPGDIWKLRMLYNYIARKKEDALPECNKLFDRGTKFNQYRPYRMAMKPRKKPNKYLGLPEEIEDSKESADTGANNDSEADSVRNKDDEDSYESVDKAYAASTKPIEVASDIETLNKPIINSYKRDPLLYLSDYYTGDEIVAKKGFKNVGVNYMKFAKPGIMQRTRGKKN